MLLGKARKYIGEFRAYNRDRNQVLHALQNKQDLLSARIVRFVHSIEKGLSIQSPRPEFGYEKIKTLYGYIKEYLELDGIDKTCIYMASDALSAYCTYHDSIGVSSEKITEIKKIASELTEIKETDKVTGIFGGVQTINKNDISFDLDTIERFFKTRHSLRQFNGTPVSDEILYKAVELAQMAPSACNRQAVRIYSMDTRKFIDSYPGNLQGVGGFIDSSDKVLIITGKISAYEEPEYKQFIVSAGIFTGYLSMALHGLGLGACVVQRSLRPNQEWSDFSRKNNIPEDEQIICLLVVGNINEQTVVPLSKRFDTKKIFKSL